MQDIPGVTRDRVSYDANWLGRRFVVQDTGGWEPDAKGLQQLVAEQASVAMRTADAIIFVVDAVVGATAADEAAARLLQRSGQAGVPGRQQGRQRARRSRRRRVVVAGAGGAAPGQRHARPRCGRSAGRGDRGAARGVGGGSGGGGPRRVALVGKPNVGKSSLLNRLAGDERSVVHDVAGTTVDPVDSLIELDGKIWRFVDTAGLRRKVGQASGHEFYASVRTRGAIDAAEVAIVLIDALAAADRAGPAGADDGDRGGPGVGAGVQQVGSGRRGPPLPAGPRDRSRAGAGAVGAAGEHLGQDGPGGAEAGARAGERAGSRGTPGSRPAG